MRKILYSIIAIILMSFYFFPIEFSFLPGINTKALLAAVGIVLFMYRLIVNRDFKINRPFLCIILLSIGVSLSSILSVVINNTNDIAYVRYVISMIVWLSGAYAVVSYIKYIHGTVSVKHICDYLIVLCVCQCIMAMLIEYHPSTKAFINTHIYRFASAGSPIIYDSRDRLYGIGAAIDVAGTRFAAVLVMIAMLCVRTHDSKYYRNLPIYILSFIVIVVIGNMIARTTTVGAVMSLVYWFFYIIFNSRNSIHFRRWLAFLVIILLPIISYYYNHNSTFNQLVRFGFEGFFSIAETGKWQTNSSDILATMYRFPETIKTWLIGDGYFETANNDPYYIGYFWEGFYMGTDVGYLRFIFYFGLIGLLFFVVYFFVVAKACIVKFPEYKLLFIMLLFLNYIIWFKVSTDLFVVFALFLCIPEEDNDAYENPIPDQLDV